MYRNASFRYFWVKHEILHDVMPYIVELLHITVNQVSLFNMSVQESPKLEITGQLEKIWNINWSALLCLVVAQIVGDVGKKKGLFSYAFL